jgi:UDP-glucose 4-epimerase
MRVLVTGGAGYIGSVTVQLLLARGHEVEVLDDLSSGHVAALPAGLIWHRGNLADTELLARIFSLPYDAVLHFAASSLVEESMQRPLPYYRNNVAGTLALVERVAAGGARRFVFSSSAAVYGQPAQSPIDEGSALVPVNPYGRTKLAMEWILADAASVAGFAAVALRYFNAAGAAHGLGEDHRPESHLIPRLLHSLLEPAEPFRIFGDDYPTADGTCIRDYIHVTDLADAHVRALDWAREPGFTAINLGTSQGTSVWEVVAAATRITGLSVPTLASPRRPGDPACLVAANERANRLLGWRPDHSSIETILSDAWHWHRRHPRGYPD